MSEPTQQSGVKTSFKALQLDMAPDPEAKLFAIYTQAMTRLQAEWKQRGLLPLEDVTVELRVSCDVQEQEA